MMRRLIVVQVAIAFVCVQAVGVLAAGNPDTGPGCGLGKLAWGDYKGQKQIAPQMMMATTNAITGTVTFGVSSGTSGCTNDGVIMNTAKVQVFAISSFENLTQEMAQGRGEHLTSLATLLGVPAEQQGEFFAMTQERYTSLLQAGETSPVAMVEALHDAVAQHSVLAQATASR